jgi:hypothetical protein
MKIDPNNPLMSSTGPLPVSPICDDLDDFDIHNRLEIVKAMAPYYADNVPRMKQVMDEIFDWVYSMDDIEFSPEETENGTQG